MLKKIIVWRWNSDTTLKNAGIKIDKHISIQLGESDIFIVQQEKDKQNTITTINEIVNKNRITDCILFLHTSGDGGFHNDDRLKFNTLKNVILFGGDRDSDIVLLKREIIDTLINHAGNNG